MPRRNSILARKDAAATLRAQLLAYRTEIVNAPRDSVYPDAVPMLVKVDKQISILDALLIDMDQALSDLEHE